MGGIALRNDPQIALLLRRMTLLNIDPGELKGADPLLFYELQGRCTLCRDKDQCALELAHAGSEDWRQYCPNETMLVMLGVQESGCLDAEE